MPFLLTAALPCWGEILTQGEAEALLTGVNQTMNPVSAEYFIKLVNSSPGGRPEEFIIYAVNQENKWAAVIASPDAFKGRTALRLANQIWYHVPGELEPRPGQLNHSMINGTLDYQTLFRIDDLPYYNLELQEDGDLRATIDLTPKDTKDHLPARTIVIDKKMHVPKMETVFSASMTPLKEISYQDIRQFGTLPPRPATIVVKSLMNDGYATTMTIGWIKSRQIPPEAFTLPFLPKVGILLTSSDD